MGDVINFPIPLDGDLGHEFITDAARHCEGLLSEQAIKTKYQIADSTWAHLGDDAVLVAAVVKEQTRRIRDGSNAREKAQQLFIGAPGVLGDILHGDGISPKHKIDSARELRAIAANGPEAAAAASDRFQITIVIGDETLKFDKSLTPDATDTDPFSDIEPQRVLTAITTNKPKGGDDDEFL